MLNEYLIEAVQGKYDFHFENRLSRIFLASFNNSKMFRDLFLKSIEYTKKTGYYYADTEIYNAIISNKKRENEIARNDIWIYHSKNKSKPVIIIENKLEAKLHDKQLKTYNKLKEYLNWDIVRKCLFLKYYEEREGWDSYHWNKFYSFIVSNVGVQALKSTNSVDIFIINNFLKYLEKLGMSYTPEIKKSEFEDVAKCIYLISNYKFEEKRELEWIPNIQKNGAFLTLNNIISMMYDVYSEIIKEEFIVKTMDIKSHFSPRLSYYKGENDKHNKLYIGFHIKVNPSKKPFNRLGTSIDFSSDNKRFIGVFAYAANQDNYLSEYVDQYKFRIDRKNNDKLLTFSSYYNFIKKSWKEYLGVK